MITSLLNAGKPHGLSANPGLPWNSDLIKRYLDNWDWSWLSSNSALPWTEQIISDFQDEWDWTELSSNPALPWTKRFVIQYATKLDFTFLSENLGIPWSLDILRAFAEKWSPKGLMVNPRIVESPSMRSWVLEQYSKETFLIGDFFLEHAQNSRDFSYLNQLLNITQLEPKQWGKFATSQICELALSNISTSQLRALLNMTKPNSKDAGSEDWYQCAQFWENERYKTVARYHQEIYNPHYSDCVHRSYLRPAKLGHREAQYKLAEHYLRKGGFKTLPIIREIASISTDPNYLRHAIEWHREAAKQGHPEAQAFLWKSFYFGKDVRQDKIEALTWLGKLAEKELQNKEMEESLGYFNFQLGAHFYLEKNFDTACEWIQQASDLGYVDGIVLLGKMHLEGKGVEKNNIRGLDLLHCAAKHDHYIALRCLGVLYESIYSHLNMTAEAREVWRKLLRRRPEKFYIPRDQLSLEYILQQDSTFSGAFLNFEFH
ncbi:Sel1 repeat [Thiorhodovibrio winogradskyi]|uniref:Sel1 repeat n=1 Tax=Thiorhodovibrio winogradskyi TaxID=77007 RepID=A0ABZ0S865_9GAMM|nr:tetratricopeptide repeat protein [Thiorhodovibrio winogradskyi]